MSILSSLLSFLPGSFSNQEARTKTQQNRYITGVPTLNTSRQAVSPDIAQGLSSAYACIDYISRMIAMMPWRVIETTRQNERILAFNHPLDPILSRAPNPEMTPFTFVHTLLSQCLGWGNGYAEIIRDPQGRIVGLMPIESRRVSIYRDADTRQIFYRVTGSMGNQFIDFPSSEIFHILALSSDGIIGRSPILDGTQVVGTALASDRTAGSFFGNQALPIGVIQIPEAVKDPEAKENIRKTWTDIYGGVINYSQVAVLDNGAIFNPVTLSPEATQLLETRKFNITEICRIFGVPPQKVFMMEGQGQASMAEVNNTTVTETLMPWAIRLEQESKRKLIGQPRFSTKFNAEALQRGTPSARWQNHRIAIQTGTMSTNEVRRLEDMPGIGPSGDVYRYPLNMTTSENFASESFQPNGAAPPGPGDGSSGGDVVEAGDNQQ